MDNPTEYIRKLEDDLRNARAALQRVERERDEYQGQAHSLEERVRNMTSAASMAAASTVKAIERIQELEPVVDAAVNYHEAALGFSNYEAALHAFQRETRGEIARRKARS